MDNQQPSFFQYGSKLIRNPSQRLSMPAGLQKAVPPAVGRAVAQRASLPLATRILPAVLSKMGPIMAGANLANTFLDNTSLGSFTHPRKAY